MSHSYSRKSWRIENISTNIFDDFRYTRNEHLPVNFKGPDSMMYHKHVFLTFDFALVFAYQSIIQSNENLIRVKNI